MRKCEHLVVYLHLHLVVLYRPLIYPSSMKVWQMQGIHHTQGRADIKVCVEDICHHFSRLRST
jgi:hypothetical protein